MSWYPNFHPGFIASRRYPLSPAVVAGTAVAAVNTIYWLPFILPAQLAITKMSIQSTAGGAGSAVKMGIWANSPVSMRPLGAPIVADNTGAATTGTGSIDSAAVSATLDVGNLYWAGMKFTGTLPSVEVITNLRASGLAFLFGAKTSNVNKAFSFADAYANAMPTLAEGATFTDLATDVVPLMYAVT